MGWTSESIEIHVCYHSDARKVMDEIRKKLTEAMREFVERDELIINAIGLDEKETEIYMEVPNRKRMP